MMMTPSPSPETFQIGWICALPIEAAAATQMLDEKFDILEDQDIADTNTYTLGRIGKHYVVIACLPTGQYGTSSATSVANHMLRTFSKSLRIGLMVGIGGGIPSPDHDIRLGDIVISHPNASCGGVIQHDMGKIQKDGKIHRTGASNTIPRSLLTALGQMRAAELTDDPAYPVYVQNAIERNVRTQRNFGRPDLQTDRLFQAACEHPEHASSCEDCSVEWEINRSPREENGPQAHYGIIASGNVVVKHAATRDQIREETGALCCEMEAAGLTTDFPCIVIRGICDYADSHKNKQWQGYAALAAAAYAKELLTYVARGVILQEDLVSNICTKLEDVKESLDKTFVQQETHHREKMARVLNEDQRRCHQIFKTSAYEQHKNINPHRAVGTCEWVLQSVEYVRWGKNNCNDLLWISADPGCGKSVLSKSLVDEIFKTSTSATPASVCYFFFKDNEEQNNVAAAFCAILHQLFSHQPQLIKHALPSWERNKDRLQHEPDELWRIFTAAVSDPESESVICLFDALDECRNKDRDRLIRYLERFYNRQHSSSQRSWTKFLITSRPYNDIQEGFHALTKAFPQIHLRGEEENDQIHKEINIVVKMKVAELGDSLNLRPRTQERLLEEFLQMNHRTYLWLYLAIDDIRNTFENSLRPDEESIQWIPKSVNAAYEKILDRVAPEQERTVKAILQIIVGARRPLTISEMAMALGVATSSGQTAAQAGVNPEGLGKKIRRLCGLFVFINDSRIYLIHQTAREFLIRTKAQDNVYRKWSFRADETEFKMAWLCVRYLLFRDLIGNAKEDRIRSLLNYSAQNWTEHFANISWSSSPAEEEMLEGVRKLYDISSQQFKLWFPIYWREIIPNGNPPKMSALHCAAFTGHDLVIERLLYIPTSMIRQRDSMGVDALQWASLRGQSGIVKWLLEKGADVNAQGGKYGNALHAAVSGGYKEIVQQLLDSGADVNAQGEYFANALQAAAATGHEAIVQLLLNNGADVNARGGRYGTTLQSAVVRGHGEIVQYLLNNGADINAQGGQFGNALQAAAAGGYTALVKQLLNKGADINIQGGQYGNALQAAAATGHEDIVQIVLENGADVNARGGLYGRAAEAANHKGHTDIAKLLEHQKNALPSPSFLP